MQDIVGRLAKLLAPSGDLKSYRMRAEQLLGGKLDPLDHMHGIFHC
jgi:hypothetical protein